MMEVEVDAPTDDDADEDAVALAAALLPVAVVGPPVELGCSIDQEHPITA